MENPTRPAVQDLRLYPWQPCGSGAPVHSLDPDSASSSCAVGAPQGGSRSLGASELEAEARARGRGPLVCGGEVEARLLQVVVTLWTQQHVWPRTGQSCRLGEPLPQRLPTPYQLAVAQASLWRSRAGASLHPLLFALGWPRGEHGGVTGERGLTEIFVLEAVFCVDSPPREIRQKPGRKRC